MLSSEILADVFRWLDRRFIETRLRLAGHRANSLVTAHLAVLPRLAELDALIFCIDVGGVPRFELEFRRSTAPTVEQRRLPLPPFDDYAFDAPAVPRYIAAARLRLAIDAVGGERWRSAVGPMVQVTERRRQQPPVAVNYIFTFPFPRRSNLKTCLTRFLSQSWTPAGALSVDLAEARAAILPADPLNGLLATRAFTSARQLTLRDLLDECDEETVAGCAAWLHLPLERNGQHGGSGDVEGRELFAPCWGSFDHESFVGVLLSRFMEDTLAVNYTVNLSASYRNRRPVGEKLLERRIWKNMRTGEALMAERVAPPPNDDEADDGGLVYLEAAADEDDDEDDSDYDDRDECFSGDDEERWLLIVRRGPVKLIKPPSCNLIL